MRAVLNQATEDEDKASAGSNLGIKVKLHLSLKKGHFRGTSMSQFTQPESQSQQGSGQLSHSEKAIEDMSQTALLVLQPETGTTAQA